MNPYGPRSQVTYNGRDRPDPFTVSFKELCLIMAVPKAEAYRKRRGERQAWAGGGGRVLQNLTGRVCTVHCPTPWAERLEVKSAFI